jgi:hypothetical protein
MTKKSQVAQSRKQRKLATSRITWSLQRTIGPRGLPKLPNGCGCGGK